MLGDGVTGALSVDLEAPVLGMVALPLLLVFAAIAAGWALCGVQLLVVGPLARR